MGITKETILVELKTKMSGFKEGMSQATESAGELRKNLKTTTGVGKKLGLAFGTIAKQMQGFRMELLGMMFGGMMIMRTFQNILRSGMETFMKITQGATETASAMIGLSAEFEYLKFTVGRAISEALLPLMPFIITIVRAIGSWVKENPKLTGTITLLGIALGGLLFIFGSIGLLLNSLTIFFTEGIGAAIISFVGTALTGLAAALGISVGWLIAIIAAIVLVVAAFIYFWNTSEAFRQFWKNMWEGMIFLPKLLWFAIKKIFQVIWAFLEPIVEAIGELFAAMWEFVKEGLLLAWEYIKIIFGPLVSWFSETVIDPLISIWEGLKEKLKVIFEWILEKAKAIGSAIAKPIKAVAGVFSSGAASMKSKRESLGSRQFGGIIPKTGMYQMHRGEKVSTPGNTNSFGGITINVNSSGGQIDVRKIADALMSEIKRRTA